MNFLFMKKNKKTTKKTKAKSGLRAYVYWFWGLFLLGILSVVALFSLTAAGVFGPLPDETRLEDPEKDLATLR